MGELRTRRIVNSREDLASMFADFGFKVGAEIGVDMGSNAMCLLDRVPGLKLYCVDPWKAYGNISRSRAERHYQAARSNLSGRSEVIFIRKTSADALADIPDNSLDFVYIDGDHSTENVLFDVTNWSKKVREGGIVSGHDYVVKRGCGIIPAVDAYAKENNITICLTKDELSSFFWRKGQKEFKYLSFFKSSRRGASRSIRANQVAEYLGAPINPSEGFEQDACIFVKYVPENFPNDSYVDIIDHFPYIRQLMDFPQVKVLVCSQVAERYLRGLIQNKIIVIPHHHCNYEKEFRQTDTIRRVGIVGKRTSYEMDYVRLAADLKMMGMELVTLFKAYKRQQVVDFYKTIDAQIIFRKSKALDKGSGKIFSSLKITNAASFGVPTIAFPEQAMIDEYNGAFLPVFRFRDITSALWKLKKDQAFYRELSQKLLAKAEDYHINRISEMYRKLIA